jgi:adenine phosphoribosyltransferase
MTEGDRILIVDDVLATGGTADATGRLVAATGATVVGFGFLIELAFLAGRARIDGYRVESVMTVES